MRLFSYDESSRFENLCEFYDTLMSDIFRSVTPLVNESLPLENLFMAIFSRNHIEKQVFNIGDLSPM